MVVNNTSYLAPQLILPAWHRKVAAQSNVRPEKRMGLLRFKFVKTRQSCCFNTTGKTSVSQQRPIVGYSGSAPVTRYYLKECKEWLLSKMSNL